MQKHSASRLHYDFRLEIDGVLKSWSVPKGPSLDPNEKRLAVQTEDHPLEYGDFEGVIPEGEYGGGTVMLWDAGTFEVQGDPIEGLEKGSLTFALYGHKLAGTFTLKRMARRKGERNWLLLKRTDGYANDEGDVVEDQPTSVKSGRDMAEIAQEEGGSDKQIRKAAATDPSPWLDALQLDEAGDVWVEGVRLTSPEKVLYPRQNLTKVDLAAYYLQIQHVIMPHLRARPVTLVRCPQGHGDHCFYQRHPQAGHPDVLGLIELEEKRGPTTYMVIEDFAGLLGAVQLGSLEVHIWGSRRDRPDRPDRMVFDLDPGRGVTFEAVQAAALDLRDTLKEAGLVSYCMTTGGQGLHLVVPLSRYHDFDEVKAYARGWARRLKTEQPERFIDQSSKAKRNGRIFVDYLRNDRGATAVCPYSTRAEPGAPVATPVSWAEVEGELDPAAFDAHSMPLRVQELDEDPWPDYFEHHQRITAQAWKILGA